MGDIATPQTELVVSPSGQMSLPAAVRHRWGLDHGGRVTLIDLGAGAVLLPANARPRLVRSALSAPQHQRFVAGLDDPDLAST